MAINFTTLTGAKTVSGSIANWVNYANIPAADIVTEAEAWIYDRLRCHEMRKSASVTITAAQEFAPYPTDFISPIEMKVDQASCPLVHKAQPGELLELRERDSTGTLSTADPSAYTVLNERFEFDVLARANDTARLFYYASGEALVTAETNFLTTKYPTLLRRVCLAYAYEHRKNTNQYERYVALAEKDIRDANRNADLISGGAA